MHKAMETELSHETVFRNSAPHHRDIHWLHHRCQQMNTKVCSVTSEPTQSTNRRVSSFKDSSALLKM